MKNSCARRALKLDIYKEQFRLQLPGETDHYRTMNGACFSFITLFLLLSYGIFKMENLVTLSDYQVKQQTRIKHFSQSAPFGSDDGFALAHKLKDDLAVGVDGKVGKFRFLSHNRTARTFRQYVHNLLSAQAVLK